MASVRSEITTNMIGYPRLNNITCAKLNRFQDFLADRANNESIACQRRACTAATRWREIGQPHDGVNLGGDDKFDAAGVEPRPANLRFPGDRLYYLVYTRS
jgi:hypothetical protein